ncbi:MULTISPECIES: hypothetical protein [Burkholderia cepacia complex]|jgi:hypothetical protein|uniref:hypothetical protein n=1 Tax=Burkholderia cepacia complex TaxID=87882 RepID=UPI00158D7881|nr:MULTISPECIES: hypothetical protein [Burkholderia cepacia complex]MCA8037119.1 hypothetical protein [Burkholderia arboris]
MLEVELFRERVRRNLAYVVMAALISISAVIITGFQQQSANGEAVSDTMKGLVIGNLFTLSGLVIAFYFKSAAERAVTDQPKDESAATADREDR